MLYKVEVGRVWENQTRPQSEFNYMVVAEDALTAASKAVAQGKEDMLKYAPDLRDGLIPIEITLVRTDDPL